MTSTNDGKDVKSIQTSVLKGKTHFIEFYKTIDAGLSTSTELSDRVKYLCEAWRQVHHLCLYSVPDTQAHLINWIQRYTARNVFQEEWRTPKGKAEHNRLKESIEIAVREVKTSLKSNHDSNPQWKHLLAGRGEWFLKNLENPWDHPVLKKQEPITAEEMLEWLKEEHAIVFMTRLIQLSAAKCDVLALRLVSTIMDRVRDETELVADVDQADENIDKARSQSSSIYADRLTKEAGFTKEVWRFLTDLEFVLLHKRNQRDQCIKLAKQTPLSEAPKLVERLQYRQKTPIPDKKLWKNASKIATLIAQVVIVRCMVVPRCAGAVQATLYLCGRALAAALGPDAPAAARALAGPAESAMHLYTLADAYHEQSSEALKPFVCELYVRAITAGMNELEKLKLKTEKQTEARSTEQMLASWFMQLSNLLSRSERMKCECILTAFSVHPSPIMYQTIQVAPELPPIALDTQDPKEAEKLSEFGSWATDSRSQTNLVKTSETLNLKQTQHQANVLSTAIITEGEALGLSGELCQDIIVLLAGPRVKTLSWDMDRELLLDNCRTYMERTNGGTKALTTELKYLNLDPRAYQHLPEEDDNENDMFYGIEKGYEHLVEFQEDEPDETWPTMAAYDELHSPYSSNVESDFSGYRRKKKVKTVFESSEEEYSTLNILAENKKKERPHSKERSKERSQTNQSKEKPKKEPKTKKKAKSKEQKQPDSAVDPLDISGLIAEQKKEKTETKEKKKEKRVRKKKEEKIIPKCSSLSRLVGKKICKQFETYKTASVTDSDYDSQGKCSINSLNSEGAEEVVFDGLYSMDDIKSPEKDIQNKTVLPNKEFSFANVINKSAPSKPTRPLQITKSSQVIHKAPVTPIRPVVKTEEVKKTKSVLIEYRKQLNPNYGKIQRPNAAASASSSTKPTILKPESNFQAQIRPKPVVIPDIPKVFINKNQSQEINMLKNEVNKILHRNQSRHQTLNKSILNADSVRSPDIPHSTYRSAHIVTKNNAHVNPARTASPYVWAQETKLTDKQFHTSLDSFVKELKETINAGAGVSNRSKIVKPTANRTTHPVKLETKNKSAKQGFQNKSENDITFSRLSYLHKNKQLVDALIEHQDAAIKEYSVTSDMNRTYGDYGNRNERISTPKSDVNISRTLNNVSITRKVDTPRHISPPTERSLLSKPSILERTLNQSPRCDTYKNISTEKPENLTKPQSSLSEKDHQDILRILRQKNHLNNVHSVLQKGITPKREDNQMQPTYSNLVPPTVHNERKVNNFSTTQYQIPKQESDIGFSNQQQDIEMKNKIMITDMQTIKPPGCIKQTPGKNVTTSKLTRIKSSNVKKILNYPKMDNTTNPQNIGNSDSKDKPSEDWEVVMNAIRAQKTPCRGPKALDVALNKSSIEQAFSDIQREQINSKLKSLIHQNKLNNEAMISNQQATTLQSTPSTTCSDETSILKISQPNLKIPKEVSNQIGLPKKVANASSVKQFTCPLPKDDDPFISGIENSDYDLIEALMDDDLRQEIGELSSDEEFNPPSHVVKKTQKTIQKNQHFTPQDNSQSPNDIKNQILQMSVIRINDPSKIVIPSATVQTANIANFTPTSKAINLTKPLNSYVPTTNTGNRRLEVAQNVNNDVVGNIIVNAMKSYTGTVPSHAVPNLAPLSSDSAYEPYRNAQPQRNIEMAVQQNNYKTPNVTLHQPMRVTSTSKPVIINNVDFMINRPSTSTVTTTSIIGAVKPSPSVCINRASDQIQENVKRSVIISTSKSNDSAIVDPSKPLNLRLNPTNQQQETYTDINVHAVQIQEKSNFKPPTEKLSETKPEDPKVHQKVLSIIDKKTKEIIGTEVVTSQKPIVKASNTIKSMLTKTECFTPEINENLEKVVQPSRSILLRSSNQFKVSKANESNSSPRAESVDVGGESSLDKLIFKRIKKIEDDLKNAPPVKITKIKKTVSKAKRIGTTSKIQSKTTQPEATQSETTHIEKLSLSNELSTNNSQSLKVSPELNEKPDAEKRNDKSQTIAPDSSIQQKRMMTRSRSSQSLKSETETPDLDMVVTYDDNTAIKTSKSPKDCPPVLDEVKKQVRHVDILKCNEIDSLGDYSHLPEVTSVHSVVSKDVKVDTPEQSAEPKLSENLQSNDVTIDTFVLTEPLKSVNAEPQINEAVTNIAQMDITEPTAERSKYIAPTEISVAVNKHSKRITRSQQSEKMDSDVTTIITKSVEASTKSQMETIDSKLNENITLDEKVPTISGSVKAAADVPKRITRSQQCESIDRNEITPIYTQSIETRSQKRNTESQQSKTKSQNGNPDFTLKSVQNVDSVQKQYNENTCAHKIPIGNVEITKPEQITNTNNAVDSSSNDSDCEVVEVPTEVDNKVRSQNNAKCRVFGSEHPMNISNSTMTSNKKLQLAKNAKSVISYPKKTISTRPAPSVQYMNVYDKRERLKSNKKDFDIQTIKSSEIPQSFKDSFKIEHIATDHEDSLKKIIRIRSPNGKTFKATIHGMCVNFDTLFEEPSIRNILMNNFTDKKRFTLNFYQVSNDKPTKLLNNNVQEIKAQTEAAEPVETIVLSDDDDDNVHDDVKTNCFKTKYGNYNVKITDTTLIDKHQKKFDQECRVNIMRQGVKCYRNKSKESKMNCSISPLPPVDSLPDSIEQYSLSPQNDVQEKQKDISDEKKIEQDLEKEEIVKTLTDDVENRNKVVTPINVQKVSADNNSDDEPLVSNLTSNSKILDTHALAVSTESERNLVEEPTEIKQDNIDCSTNSNSKCASTQSLQSDIAPMEQNISSSCVPPKSPTLITSNYDSYSIIDQAMDKIFPTSPSMLSAIESTSNEQSDLSAIEPTNSNSCDLKTQTIFSDNDTSTINAVSNEILMSPLLRSDHETSFSESTSTPQSTISAFEQTTPNSFDFKTTCSENEPVDIISNEILPTPSSIQSENETPVSKSSSDQQMAISSVEQTTSSSCDLSKSSTQTPSSINDSSIIVTTTEEILPMPPTIPSDIDVRCSESTTILHDKVSEIEQTIISSCDPPKTLTQTTSTDYSPIIDTTTAPQSTSPPITSGIETPVKESVLIQQIDISGIEQIIPTSCDLPKTPIKTVSLNDENPSVMDITTDEILCTSPSIPSENDSHVECILPDYSNSINLFCSENIHFDDIPSSPILADSDASVEMILPDVKPRKFNFNSSATKCHSPKIIEIEDSSSNDSVRDYNMLAKRDGHLKTHHPLKEASYIQTLTNKMNVKTDCFVKLTNCDKLVKSYENLRIMKQFCYVPLTRCDKIVKKLKLDSTLEDLNIEETGRTSPLMEIFEKIAFLQNQIHRKTEKLQIPLKFHRVICDSDWTLTKQKLSKLYSDKFVQITTMSTDVAKEANVPLSEPDHTTMSLQSEYPEVTAKIDKLALTETLLGELNSSTRILKRKSECELQTTSTKLSKNDQNPPGQIENNVPETFCEMTDLTGNGDSVTLSNIPSNNIMETYRDIAEEIVLFKNNNMDEIESDRETDCSTNSISLLAELLNGEDHLDTENSITNTKVSKLVTNIDCSTKCHNDAVQPMVLNSSHPAASSCSSDNYVRENRVVAGSEIDTSLATEINTSTEGSGNETSINIAANFESNLIEITDNLLCNISKIGIDERPPIKMEENLVLKEECGVSNISETNNTLFVLKKCIERDNEPVVEIKEIDKVCSDVVAIENSKMNDQHVVTSPNFVEDSPQQLDSFAMSIQTEDTQDNQVEESNGKSKCDTDIVHKNHVEEETKLNDSNKKDAKDLSNRVNGNNQSSELQTNSECSDNVNIDSRNTDSSDEKSTEDITEIAADTENNIKIKDEDKTTIFNTKQDSTFLNNNEIESSETLIDDKEGNNILKSDAGGIDPYSTSQYHFDASFDIPVHILQKGSNSYNFKSEKETEAIRTNQELSPKRTQQIIETKNEEYADQSFSNELVEQNVESLNRNESIEDNCFKNNAPEKYLLNNDDAIVLDADKTKCDVDDFVIKGVEYQDPVVGTCYVFSIVGSPNFIDPTINDNTDELETDSQEINIGRLGIYSDDFIPQITLPKKTYSKMYDLNDEDLKVGDKKNKRNLKRKLDVNDGKLKEKKYRKGKNIDYPKFTKFSLSETIYTKEYKRLFDYYRSIQFSYTRPFHIDHIDVDPLHQNWPIQSPIQDFGHSHDFSLFNELEIATISDPLTHTLAEELITNYDDIDNCSSNEINETNFKMGFGEESGRVINLGLDVSKFPAATLSDVKQSQPILQSAIIINSNRISNKTTNDEQLEIIKRYTTSVQLKNKIRGFFRQNTRDLIFNKDHKFCESNEFDCDTKDLIGDLCRPDFLKPFAVEHIVQVVQVGQLPVSAAAQNPVTCDPRVTQVSDASPSQCSMESSPNDDPQSVIKTEYTELTTADLPLSLVHSYSQHTQEHEQYSEIHESENCIPIPTELKSVVKIELVEEMPEEKNEDEIPTNNELEVTTIKIENDVDYSYESSPKPDHYTTSSPSANTFHDYSPAEQEHEPHNILSKQYSDRFDKKDQIAHAMTAAGIPTSPEPATSPTPDVMPEMCQGAGQYSNNYQKISAVSLQQALAQILPPPLNQTSIQENGQHGSNTSMTPQVLHIVKNASGNQITLVDNGQQSVINSTGAAAPVLHIVQNKGTSQANGTPGTQTSTFSGLSLVDTGFQQGNNQLLHIVNTGGQNNNTGQLLKRVNLLTNVTNAQGSSEQKIVQFVCKSADGKSIQLNAQHQRGMVLRLQPFENSSVQSNSTRSVENHEPSQSPGPTCSTSINEGGSQQELKSRVVYEENFAQFINNSSSQQTTESTSLPKFNQAFGKQIYQDETHKQDEITNNNSHLQSMNPENSECQSSENSINLEQIDQMNSPPLLLRKSSTQTTQAQTNLVQQIKQTMAPIMHGGVIYTRQIPVNIGGGQTINLITVPSSELEDSNQKQQSEVKFVNQNEIDSPIIKIVPQNQTTSNGDVHQEENNANVSVSAESTTTPQPQPVLTQMRIKLPMLSKNPQVVSGARVVRPSFFQIQRNVIGGANQPVYQQLVLTAAPPLGQQTIRLPQNQTQTSRTVKLPSENPSTSESQMSSSTLEQLREFDLVLEQVKERSTGQPNASGSFTKRHSSVSESAETPVSTSSSDSTPQSRYSTPTPTASTVYTTSRKSSVSTSSSSSFVRSPDSSGIIDTPSSSHATVTHTVRTEPTPAETPTPPKATKSSNKPRSRPKASSNPPNTLKLPVPTKTSSQKPLEDEQTTQRILYILAEYKEQVENSPDKDKPAPRRRTNLPINPSGSKRRKGSFCRRHCMSPVQGEDSCRTMGSEDSSCGTSLGDCNESECLHSPQESPRKVVRRLTFDHETPLLQQRPQPRNVILADGQTITLARGTAGKPTTAVLMPANYILPVSMVKGGQQIAIVTNRGPKLLTVTGSDGATTNALLLQRLVGPADLKPVLTRPGVRHVRLPAAALHNLQTFNLTTATTTVQPPDSTATSSTAPNPPELIDTRATSSPWAERDSQDPKPDSGSSPEGSGTWNLPTSSDPLDYAYEETVRTDNHMDRTVLDSLPDRYTPDMEAQRIFDKMFDVDSKKSFMVDNQDDSPRCGYDLDTSDCDDKAYHQVVHRKDGTQRRLTHVSAAALRHKYAILEHELRLQKSLSEECEDLGVDSPSASELFPEAELLFGSSPAHEHTQDHHAHTSQTTITSTCIPQPDMDDQIATDHLLRPAENEDDLGLGLEDVGIVTVSEDGMQATIALDQEEFARSHPNTTFHSEPTEEGEIQPFTIAGFKGRQITSTIFHANRAPATVLMTTPQTTVISQATPDGTGVQNNIKYDIGNMIDTLPHPNNINISSVLVKDGYSSILNDNREIHISNTASAIVHSTGNATQVIRRVRYEDRRDARYTMVEPGALIGEDSRDAALESMPEDIDDDRSSPERHADLFWESNSERSEGRRPDFSSDSDKCCKSPSYDSTDSSGASAHVRLDSVIKDARDCTSLDDGHPPLRTYPAKRSYQEVSLSGKTRAGERRASNRGVVKRDCHCCTGETFPSRTKKPRPRKPTLDFASN